MKPAAAAPLVGLLLLAPAAPAADRPRPLNLLIVTADDMNADSPGWMGNKLGATPNLDAFAAGCHRFVNHHVSAPICQPSRSALMTGRVPHRNGAVGFNPIHRDVPTLVEVLAKAGYHTAAVNKTAHMAPRDKFPWDLAPDGSGKDPKAFGAHVAKCLKAAADAGKPFFLNANITDPHRPFPGSDQKKAAQVQGAAVEPYPPADVAVPSFLEDVPDVRREVAEYYTGVRRFDRSFGELMTALTAAGRADDTLIVFLSDHGMSFPFSKATVYRNGTWSPALLRWPGMPAAAAHDEFTSSVDLMPTVLDILGVKHPDGMDGRSWLPLLKGEKQPDRDVVVTHVNTVSSGKSFPQRCVRTKAASLMFHAWADGEARFRVEAMNGRSFAALAAAGKTDPRIRSRVDQFVVGTPLSFFDLVNDPDERTNRVADPARRAEVDRLAGLLAAHMERTKDPQLDAFRKALGRRPLPVAAADPAYVKELQAWRDARDKSLRADNGWLTLAGRFPLKAGANTFGTGKGNDVVFPPELKGTGPDRLGTLRVDADPKRVTLRLADGVEMLAGDKPFTGERALGTDPAKRDWVGMGRLRMHVFARDDRYVLRLADNESAVRKNFAGLVWYPADERFKVEATFVPYPPDKTIRIVNVRDEAPRLPSPGYAEFKLAGETHRLDAIAEGEGLMFVFRDGTAGETTYRAGRFVTVEKKPKDNEVFTLDFNKAYNPPCAFSEFTTCPLPPPQNVLKARVEAGEKYREK